MISVTSTVESSTIGTVEDSINGIVVAITTGTVEDSIIGTVEDSIIGTVEGSNIGVVDCSTIDDSTTTGTVVSTISIVDGPTMDSIDDSVSNNDIMTSEIVAGGLDWINEEEHTMMSSDERQSSPLDSMFTMW